MRVHIVFDFNDTERRQIGRRDGRPGPARRSDLREFIGQALGLALAGRMGRMACGPERVRPGSHRLTLRPFHGPMKT
jgi:hypothetical protein